MPLGDYRGLPGSPRGAGIPGKWVASRERGGRGVGVLANPVQPGRAAPLHRHEYEEVILVEAGKIWVEIDRKARQIATPGQCVIIPANTPHAWGCEGPEVLRVLFIWNSSEPFAAGKSTYLEGAPPVVS